MTSVSSGKTLLHLSCLAIPVHFSSLITKIWISLLPSPVWPHPTCLHSWTSHSRFLSNTVLYSIGLFFYCQTHWQLSSFHFGLASSFFLDLLVIALHSSLVAYLTPSDLGKLIFWSHNFLHFHTVHGVLEARILEQFVIPSPEDHILPEFSTMSCPRWVALHGIASVSFASSVSRPRLLSLKESIYKP